MGVLVRPGRIALTRIPLVASSTAIALVNATTPPLEAVYAESPGKPPLPRMLAMFTIAAPVTFRNSMCFTVSLVTRKVPLRLVLMTSSNVSSVRLTTGVIL
uniref:Putative secreted protein n=1 Tax=Ixodes ricinus TaxID=34613 RepID=A0A6B0UIB6_IXORI